MNLSDLKRERGILYAVLDAPEGATKILCPFHNERTESCKIYETNGIWFFKCFGCSRSGTIIDAVLAKYNLRDTGQAFNKIEEMLGIKITRDEETVEIVLNMERAEKVLKLARKTLDNDFEVQETYMQERRNIRSLETLQKYNVGFLKDVIIKPEYVKWGVMRFWTFPITDEKGNLKWLKCHQEKSPKRIVQENTGELQRTPKAFAFPLGTYPAPVWQDRKLVQKPKHGTVSLFPAPELIPKTDILYLAPGELKALALLALGFSSLSITQGETGKIPDSLLRRIKNHFSKICLVYDNDGPGIIWRDAITKQLKESGFSVLSFTASELLGKDKTGVTLEGAANQNACTAKKAANATLVYPSLGKRNDDGQAKANPVISVSNAGSSFGEVSKASGIRSEVNEAAPASFPKNWKSEVIVENLELERAELMRKLKEGNVIVYEADSIETLRQAMNVLEASQREDTGGRRIDPYWPAQLEKNRLSFVAHQNKK